MNVKHWKCIKYNHNYVKGLTLDKKLYLFMHDVYSIYEVDKMIYSCKTDRTATHNYNLIISIIYK